MAWSPRLVPLVFVLLFLAVESVEEVTEVSDANTTEYEIYEFYEYPDDDYYIYDVEEVEESAVIEHPEMARLTVDDEAAAAAAGKAPGKQQRKPPGKQQRKPPGKQQQKPPGKQQRKPQRQKTQQRKGQGKPRARKGNNKRPGGKRRRTLRVSKDCECGVGGGTSGGKMRIVNGQTASVNEFPWMVAIMQDGPGAKDRQYCGGSLINNLYVVTAAHCVVPFKASEIVVRLGEHRLSTNDESKLQVRQVERIIINGNYKPKTNTNDIALIKMKKPANINNAVGTVCLSPANFNFNGKQATVSGWGRTAQNGAAPDELRKVDVTIVSNKECQSRYKSANINITPTMMCAGGDKRDSCQGDSGGPMVVAGDKGKSALVGIVSMGLGCGSERFPGIYTRVGAYRNFIRKYARDGVFCQDGNLKGKN